MAAAAPFSVSARRNEQWHGRTQLRFITGTADGLDADAGELQETLRQLREIVFTGNRLHLNLTGDAEGLERLSTAAGRLIDSLPAGKPPARTPDQAGRSGNHIGIAIPAQVCYVAELLKAPPYRDPLAAPLFVLARQLSNGDLYRRIRVQGGAYGGACRYEPLAGLFAFFSYRDPHLATTLDNFRHAVDCALRSPISGEDLDKAIIGAIGAIDRPLDPAGRGYTALIREFSDLPDGDRRHFRNAVLAVTAQKLQEAARRYFPQAMAAAVVAVCAAEDRLKRANESLQEPLTIEKLL
jgi:Zn-dependent M16 (insulinase) family peptidase